MDLDFVQFIFFAIEGAMDIIKQIADFAEVNTPNINATLDWYKSIAIEKDEFMFRDYGITDRKSFAEFYLK